MDQIQKSIKAQSSAKATERSPHDMSDETTLNNQQLVAKPQDPSTQTILDQSTVQPLKSLVPPQSAFSEAYDNLHEINPIVATMDLEEISGSEDGFDSDEEELSENEYGMNNVRDEISEDYIQEMEALIRKHAMTNLGTGPEPKEPPIVSSKAPTKPSLSIRNKPEKLTDSLGQKPKKGVKFAEELDIASESLDSAKPTDIGEVVIADAPPMADVIIERPMTVRSDPLVTEKKPKISKFKAAMLARSDASASSTTIESTPASLAGDLSFKDELHLYNQRMKKPEHQVDRKLYDDANMDSSVGKMSKFKAERRGIAQDLDR
jgi:hypothetical protein